MPVVESDGFRWMIEEDGVDGQLGPTNHEAELSPYLQTDGVFWDIGADVGRWSVRVADLATHVYAFEPHAGRRQRLEENLELNEVLNCTVLQVGASDVLETCSLGRTGHAGDPGEQAMFVPLDSDPELSAVPVDLIKLDIEGWEGKALRGMTHILEVWHPRLVIEMHDHLYGAGIRDDVLGTLVRLGYRQEIIADINGQQYWQAT